MFKIFVLIFVMHIVAGFFLQTKKISKLKRERKRYLFLHVVIYTLFFIAFSPILLDLTILQGLVYGLLNGLLHYVVDYVTGKFKIKYSEDSGVKFKLIVVADYASHLLILMSSYYLLFKTSLINLPF